MKKSLLYLVAAVVVVVGIYLVMSKPAGNGVPSPTPTPTPTPTASVSKTPTPSPITRQPQTFQVAIQNFAFVPASVTVKQGDTVVFKNGDTAAHTVTATDGSFNSGTIVAGAQWSLATANLAPGTYVFTCGFHASMRGTLVVQ
jgi:plastocyanin